VAVTCPLPSTVIEGSPPLHMTAAVTSRMVPLESVPCAVKAVVPL
jgi:hypothetical protein